MSEVYDVAGKYVRDLAAIDPLYATTTGLGEIGQDRLLPDYSPDGVESRLDLDRRSRAAMASAPSSGPHDDVAKRVFDETLNTSIIEAESNENLSRLSVMWSPVQQIRESFDLLPRDSTEQWKTVAARMAAVPAALASLTAGLREGQVRGVSAARRQAEACARQARVWSGHDGGNRYFQSLVVEYRRRGTCDRKVDDALQKAANAADGAYGDLAFFLTDDYGPRAPESDAVGVERYGRAAQGWLGLNLDIEGAYAWGWEELRRVQDEIAQTCQEIAPGLTFEEVVAKLNGDHERVMHGEEQQRDWLQALMVRTVSRLDGTHFDIPPDVQPIEVRIAPIGTAAAQYYLPPSDDLSRPGTYWFPASGRTRFPIWNEISTAYHQGVPGHHLLAGHNIVRRTELSDFQRHLAIHGHAQGWATYAERLMGELGYFDRPEYRLDMLSNSLLRAARVVVDIGLHVGLSIPDEHPLYGGQRWTPETAADFLQRNSSESPHFVVSEIDRYLGIPGQALSYKLGEAVWLEARRFAQKRDGAAFDLRQFHASALDIGPVGLAHLRDLLIAN